MIKPVIYPPPPNTGTDRTREIGKGRVMRGREDRKSQT